MLNRLKSNSRALAALLTLVSPFVVQALDYDAPFGVETRIAGIEASQVPGDLYFWVNHPVANCPAGNWLRWNGGLVYPPGATLEATRQVSVKNMTQILLAQKALGATVKLYGQNGAGNNYCRIVFIHAL
jgi:hypothetical protein